MTKKKTTTKGGRKGTAADSQQQSIEERARAILRDNDRYDYDTRHAIWCELHGGTGLENLVETAEKHGFVNSWNEPALSDYLEKARALFKLMYGPGTADWLTQGISDLLTAAEDDFNVKLYRHDPEEREETEGGWSVYALARTLLMHEADVIRMERVRRLPELLLAALTHPDMPDGLRMGILDVLHEQTNGRELKPSINHISWVLDCAPDAIARTLAQNEGRTIPIERKRDLPEMLAAVMRHEGLPEELRDSMRQFLGHLSESDEVTLHPDVLRVSLGIYQRDREGGEQ